MTSAVYPSMEELLPDVLRALVPAKLCDDMTVRYATLGEKYLTEKKYSDGRFINSMMDTSRIQNCVEEVVDAVFCILGWIFKCKVSGADYPHSAYVILRGLIEVYSLLEAEKAQNAYA